MQHILNWLNASQNGNVSQIISALVGAFAGAFLGAVGAFIVGEKARKRQKETDEIKYIRSKIKDSGTAILSAESELHNLLIVVMKNIGHYEDMKDGIIDAGTNQYRPTINMPIAYAHRPNLDANMLNVSCMVQWNGIENELILQNANVTEFNNFYNSLRDSLHEAKLKNEELNNQVIIADNDSIKGAAASLIVAAQSLRQRCLMVLSLIQLHKMQWKSIDYTGIDLRQITIYRNKLINYKPKDKQLESKISELDDIYQPDKAFKAI